MVRERERGRKRVVKKMVLSLMVIYKEGRDRFLKESKDIHHKLTIFI